MKWEELKMSFVYEMVGEENRELWESIGWKDVFKSPKRFYKKSYWSLDRANEIFLIAIGKYIDTPDYYDMSYKHCIIRMEVAGNATRDINSRVSLYWNIHNIYIPKSIWSEKENILNAVQEAFSVVRNLVPEDNVIEINVEILCEPTCVEVDYNGR